MSTVFGGYIIGDDLSRSQLVAMTDPNDVAIERAVTMVAGGAGVLCMRCNPTPEVGPYELTVYVDKGRFMPMLNEVAGDGESNTKTLSQTVSQDNLVAILGEKYPASAVTYDIDFVCQIFKEFARTGGVSDSLLR